jgi:pimeloyl-ACP methyl ester carboxylesterase
MRLLPIALLFALLLAAPAAASDLHWRDCDGGFQCATAKVPLDYAKPHGRTVRLAVIKHPALDQEHRIGSLFLNPGGPGGSGIEFVRTAPPPAFGLLARFDWIGWDPRGVGDSRPDIDCDSVPFEPMTPATLDIPRLLQTSRDRARGCLNGDPRFLASVNTGNAARDLDRLRAAVGDAKLNYIGISWGGVLGETYASLFPGRARALLLDSPGDADVWLNDELQAGEDQTVGFERSLDRFLAATGISEASYDALIARLDAAPLAGVDGDDVLAFTLASLYAKVYWPQLERVLRAAEAGDADGVRDIAGYSDAVDEQLDVFRTYLYVERKHPRHLRTYLAAAERLFALAPHFAFGAYEAADDLFWPVRPRGAYYGPFRNPKHASPVLVMHTTHDPASPYAWGQHVVRDLGNARLLTVNGDGHGVIPTFNPCALGAMAAYLNDLQLPPEGASCDQEGLSSRSSSIVRSSTPADWMREAYSRR